MGSAASLKILGFLVIISTDSGWAQSQSDCNRNYTKLFTASSHYLLVFSSPNYPLSYDDNTDCLWIIETDASLGPDYLVKVTFDDFQLEGYGGFTSCQYDSLTFYDGPPSGSNTYLLGKYCGTTHPDVIYSTGRYLYVKFHSDASATGKGFNFYYQAVNAVDASAICRAPYSTGSNLLSLSGSSGTFFSPDYPVPYPRDVTCIWRIMVPAGKIVKLTFENFVLSGYIEDYVKIRDDWSAHGRELGRYNYRDNAPDNPPDVYSTGRYMWVKFYSSSYGPVRTENDKGFKAHFEALDPPDDVNRRDICLPGNIHNNKLMLSGYNGTLKSPPLYPPDLSCSWLITVPDEKIVKLFFDKFDLHWRAGDCGDYVEVLDGQYTSSEGLEKFCAWTTPKAVLSSGRYMRVNFRSDYYSQSAGSDGFSATFKAVDKSSSSWLAIGVTVGVVTLILLIVCVLCVAKRRKTPNRAAGGARMPMTTTTTSASHATTLPPPRSQTAHDPVENTYSPPPVGYAPVPTNPPELPPAYPYPLESPPPYPGKEEAPQYPPPGESYPWLQDSVSAHPSAPLESS